MYPVLRPIAEDTIKREVAIPPVRCVGGVYLHHAGRSGYGLLEQYLGEPWKPSRVLQSLGNTVFRIPGRILCWYCGLFEYSRPDFVQEFALLPQILMGGPVVWHYLYAEKQFLLGSYLPKRQGTYFVGTFHHHPVKFPYMVQRTTHFRRLDLAIAMSTVQIEHLEKIVGYDKVYFIPHGIDIDYWRPSEPPPGDQMKKLIFAGNHMRDFDALEQVIDIVLKYRADVEFVLVSSDKQCGRLFRRENVRWLYRIPDDHYLKQMQSASILVLPLKYSTAVNTVLEALACGTPVVTTQGGISDYLDNTCSIQVPPGDAGRMARVVLDLLDQPERISAMRIAARRQAEKFAWPNVAAQLRSLFKTLS